MRIDATERNRAGSFRVRSAEFSTPGSPMTYVVRAAVAKRLATELDAADLPAHAVPRIANALINVVAAVDRTREAAQTKPSRTELRTLLEDVR
jgi:hypothetical protein